MALPLIATAMVWIAACFVGYKTILVAVLRKRRVLPPDAGWFSALGSRFPAHWLEDERRQSGSLWTPWGWEGVRLGPQIVIAIVFFGFVVVLWLLADAGQAIIDRWHDADGTLPGP